MREFLVEATCDGRRQLHRVGMYNPSQATKTLKSMFGYKSVSIVSINLA